MKYCEVCNKIIWPWDIDYVWSGYEDDKFVHLECKHLWKFPWDF